MSSKPSRRRISHAGVGALVALLSMLSACSSLQVFGKQDSEERAREIDVLQLRVMQFADEYVSRIIGPLNDIQTRTRDPRERLDVQNWKVSQATAAYTNASQTNPVNGALDMIVLAALSRMVVESEATAPSGRLRSAELREGHRTLEARAWELSSALLDETQKAQLREAIQSWRAANPDVRAVGLVHYGDLGASVAPAQKEGLLSKGLLGLIGIEPLQGLDPAVREIAQTRQVAQRAIYYLQRSPALLDMQVERLTYQVAIAPESERLLENVDTTADAARRMGRLADVLPALVAQEREAAITQVIAQLDAQHGKTRALAQDLRTMLDAGTLTADSVNTTVKSIDALVARFKPSTPPPPTTGSKPSRVADYTQALQQLAAATQELQQLVVTLDQSSQGAAHLGQAATATVRSVIDYLFLRLMLLALAIAVIIVAAVLTCRLALRRTGLTA